MLQQLGGPPPNGVSGVAIPSRRRGRVSARTPARCRCARSSAHASRR
jgi:hypothetical protein